MMHTKLVRVNALTSNYIHHHVRVGALRRPVCPFDIKVHVRKVKNPRNMVIKRQRKHSRDPTPPGEYRGKQARKKENKKKRD